MTSQIDILTNRVTAIDGIGAQVPSQSSVPTIKMDLNGLHTTINQLTLTLQAQLNEIAAAQTQLQGTIDQLLGNIAQPTRFVLRVPFTPMAQDITNQYIQVTVTFPTAFVDNNYVISADLELDTTSIPGWQANHTYASNAVILDNNGLIQRVTVAGLSGSTFPTFNKQSGQTTTDNAVTWECDPITAEYFTGIAKFRTAGGFVEEIFVGVVPLPMILHVTATHE